MDAKTLASQFTAQALAMGIDTLALIREMQALATSNHDVAIEGLLSNRTVAHLAEHNIKTLGDLTKSSEIDLLKLPGFGKKSILEIKEALIAHNMSLKGMAITVTPSVSEVALKPKHPGAATTRKASELGIKVTMSDEEILATLKTGGITKAKREEFLAWFRHKYNSEV